MVLPGPWHFAQRSTTVLPMAAWVVANEAPPRRTMCDLTSALSWQDEHTAAMGEIFTSSAGLTLIVRVAPRATRYVLLVFTVVPSTLVASGSSNVPLPFTSMWQLLQLRSSDGKRTSLNSFTELERPMTTNGVSRKPPAWIECTIVLKSMASRGRRCAGPTPGRW